MELKKRLKEKKNREIRQTKKNFKKEHIEKERSKKMS